MTRSQAAAAMQELQHSGTVGQTALLALQPALTIAVAATQYNADFVEADDRQLLVNDTSTSNERAGDDDDNENSRPPPAANTATTMTTVDAAAVDVDEDYSSLVATAGLGRVHVSAVVHDQHHRPAAAGVKLAPRAGGLTASVLHPRGAIIKNNNNIINNNNNNSNIKPLPADVQFDQSGGTNKHKRSVRFRRQSFANRASEYKATDSHNVKTTFAQELVHKKVLCDESSGSGCLKSPFRAVLTKTHTALSTNDLECAKHVLLNTSADVSLYQLLLLDDYQTSSKEQRLLGNFLGGIQKKANFLIKFLVQVAQQSRRSSASEENKQNQAFSLFVEILDKLKEACSKNKKEPFFHRHLQYCMLAAATLGDKKLVAALAKFTHEKKTQLCIANASIETVVDGKTESTWPSKQAKRTLAILATRDCTKQLQEIGFLEEGECLEPEALKSCKKQLGDTIADLNMLDENTDELVQTALATRGAEFANHQRLSTASTALKKCLGNKKGPANIEILAQGPDKAKDGLVKKIRALLEAGDVPSKSVQVQLERNPNAPTCGGYGLYAKRDLTAGHVILSYPGKVYSRSNDDESKYEDSDYIFKSSNGQFDIDGAQLGNEASFINHCESEKANVMFLNVLVDGFPHVFIYVKKTIKVRKSILADYGGDYWGNHGSNNRMQEMQITAAEMADLHLILKEDDDASTLSADDMDDGEEASSSGTSSS
jgi:SET domain